MKRKSIKRKRKDTIEIDVTSHNLLRKPIPKNAARSVKQVLDVVSPTLIAFDSEIAMIGRRLKDIESMQVRFAQMQRKLNEPFRHATWKMATGVEIHIKDMDEQHLRNTVSMLTRKLQVQLGSATWVESVHFMVKSLDQMLDEVKRRGLRV